MKYLILGAGPAGLSLANKLKQNGETNFLILEKERTAGGLCRSMEIDGAPMDIGGGHFLDVRRRAVNEFLFEFMPKEEWNLFERNSCIKVNGSLINHPIEANIWQMQVEDQVQYLKSIAAAGCNHGEPMPEEFVDWIYWKLGERIADDYMIPYNQKMFGEELNQLGTYWLEKLPNVSFEETLRSCLMKKAYGSEPGHAQFYYPKKYGYGELWLRMADVISGHIEFEKAVKAIDFQKKSVTTSDGSYYTADIIITTIPWLEFDHIIGMPDEICKSIAQLKYSSIVTEYFSEDMDTNAQWIYYPDPGLEYHRILVRHNFCENSRGYWTETNVKRFKNISSSEECYFINNYAYPLNTRNKPQIIARLLRWSEGNSVYGLGRWGEHQHFNSDVVVERAINIATRLKNIA